MTRPRVVTDRAPLVALALAGLGLGLVVGIALVTRSDPSGPGALLTELGRWCALVGTYGALVIIVLVARVPWLERGVGLDHLALWHRAIAPAVLVLVAAHVVLVTAGYAASEAVSYLGQTWTFLTTYPWLLPAAAGLVLMLGAADPLVAGGPAPDALRDVVGDPPVLLPRHRAGLPPPDHAGRAVRRSTPGRTGSGSASTSSPSGRCSPSGWSARCGARGGTTCACTPSSRSPPTP